jgi:D-methionine transport system ATP-binding protein
LGVTILLITHELDVIKQICQRVGVLDHGELIEVGETIEVLLNPKSNATRKLVDKTLHYTPSAPNTRLIKLTFVGESSDAPLISTLAKKFNIEINIKQAQIEKIQDITVGFTLCELQGENAELDKALAFIHASAVKAEIIPHE